MKGRIALFALVLLVPCVAFAQTPAPAAALAFGADDLDGTVVEERITHMAGATTPEALSKQDLVDMISETGHVPVERDTMYRIVKMYSPETEVPAWDAGPIGAPPLVGVAANA